MSKGATWRWYHVRVQNLGRLPAFKARAFIRKVWVRQPDRSLTPHPQWVGRMRLRWANLGQEEISLHRRDGGPWDRLDVFRVTDVDDHLHLVTQHGNAGLPTRLRPGSYELLIDVESDSARPESCGLSIEYAGNWDHVQVYQVPLDSLRGR
jgi:hypothetical protein